MKNIFYTFLISLLFSPIVSAEKPHGPKAEEVVITAGTKDNKKVFSPNTLTFERGKYYKLVITNPSDEDHYFTSDAFATHIFTRKVEVIGKDGNTAVEIHGSVHDIELKPGSSIEWFFFPMTKGKDLRLFCHKHDHEEKGMVGSINIVGDLK